MVTVNSTGASTPADVESHRQADTGRRGFLRFISIALAAIAPVATAAAAPRAGWQLVLISKIDPAKPALLVFSGPDGNRSIPVDEFDPFEHEQLLEQLDAGSAYRVGCAVTRHAAQPQLRLQGIAYEDDVILETLDGTMLTVPLVGIELRREIIDALPSRDAIYLGRQETVAWYRAHAQH